MSEKSDPRIGDLLLDSYDNGTGTRWATLYPPTVGYITHIERFHLTGPQGPNYDRRYHIKWIKNTCGYPDKMPHGQLMEYLSTRLKIQPRVSTS